MSDFVSLSEAKPGVALQWHPTKNHPLLPEDVAVKSTQKVWWQCSKGHEWESSIIGRRGNKRDDATCPVCRNAIIIQGVNDFASQLPELLPYWNSVKNIVDPSELSQASHTKSIWWKCSEGHEWQTSVKAMRLRKDGYCLICSKAQLVVGVNDLATSHPELVQFWNGPENSRDIETVTSKSHYSAAWKCNKGHKWNRAVCNQVMQESACDSCALEEAKTTGEVIDVDALQMKGETQIFLKGSMRSVACLIAMQKHWVEINGRFSKENLEKRSWVDKIHWECPEGHDYVQSISEKMRDNGRACPLCSGRKIVKGINDPLTKYPELEEYLDKEMDNPDITAVALSSKEVFNWKCPKGHQYKQSLASKLRTNLHLCKVCTGKEVQPGVNDIETTHPELVATYWHPTKNLPETPQMFSKGSHAKVWWKGPCGHEWKGSISHFMLSGRRCPACAGKKVQTGFNDAKTRYPELAMSWHPTKNGEMTLDEVGFGVDTTFWWQCEKGHEWKATARNRGALGNGCPNCGYNKSKGETEILEYIHSILPLDTQVLSSDRKAIGKELDIYIPSKNIAIEFNGVYWHSDKNPKITQTYHYDKWLLCKQQGIQLIQIWEDEWALKQEVVKSMLAHKLNASTSPRVSGRKTNVEEIPTHVAREFFDTYHIQGFASATHYLALTVSDKVANTVAQPIASAAEAMSGLALSGVRLPAEKGLEGRTVVAVLALKVERVKDSEQKTGNIVRYATSANVVGGFTKLLARVERDYGLSSMYTFSDNCVSDGKLYSSTGFTAVKDLKPDYMYVTGNRRYHKFGYRLKRFKTDPALLWEDGLSERELATLNRLHRIWDAGKVKWVKQL